MLHFGSFLYYSLIYIIKFWHIQNKFSNFAN